MRNSVAKAIRKASNSVLEYRRMKKAWARRNRNDSPKNTPILTKKIHPGESIEDFKKRRARANLRKRGKKKRLLNVC